MTPKFLSPEDITHFIQHGYVTVKNCFSRELAKERTDFACKRLGVVRDDPTTWHIKRINMALEHTEDMKAYSPRAFAAAADLVGREHRIKMPQMYYSEGFIVNFNDGADRPWEPPSASSRGWHKDGNWFHHFLDSPEQALLMIFVYSDIKPRGGGTFGALDSVGVVARYLAQRPEGVDPTRFPLKELVGQCHDFIEWTGEVGDVILMHPYMLHASSQNHSGIPRFITNPALSLAEPMNFHRPNPGDYSPVEQAILNALGVDHFDFHPTTERRRVISDQARDQEKLKAAERQALAAAK